MWADVTKTLSSKAVGDLIGSMQNNPQSGLSTAPLNQSYNPIMATGGVMQGPPDEWWLEDLAEDALPLIASGLMMIPEPTGLTKATALGLTGFGAYLKSDDIIDNLKDGNYGEAAIDVAGFVPYGKAANKLGKVANAGKNIKRTQGTLNATEGAFNANSLFSATGNTIKGAIDINKKLNAPLTGNILKEESASFRTKQYDKAKGYVDPYFKKYFGDDFGDDNFAMGGIMNVPAEVEGEEVIQTPGGEATKVKGPSHENGGVPINAPEGTKVFSKRINVDGKTMADRKLAREKQLDKAKVNLAKRPKDRITKETFDRLLAANEEQEKFDMGIQQQAQEFNQNEEAQEIRQEFMYGGKMKKYFTGTPIDGIEPIDLFTINAVSDNFGKIPNDLSKFQLDSSLFELDSNLDYSSDMDNFYNKQLISNDIKNQIDSKDNSTILDISKTGQAGFQNYLDNKNLAFSNTYLPNKKLSLSDEINQNQIGITSDNASTFGANVMKNIPTPKTGKEESATVKGFQGAAGGDGSSLGDMLGDLKIPGIDKIKDAFSSDGDKDDSSSTDFKGTKGDLIGKGATAIGKYAPGIMTLLNRAGDTKNTNEFKNYGQEGLATISRGIGNLKGISDKALQDAKFSETAQMKRMQNSARGVNTLRGLQQMVDVQGDKQKASIYNNYSAQMMQALNQKSQMQNQRDSMVMQGEQKRDLADRQDRDNFFTQMNKDINTMSEFGQKQAKDLNTAQKNQDFLNMLPSISKYGLGYTFKDGKMSITQVDKTGNKKKKEETVEINNK